MRTPRSSATVSRPNAFHVTAPLGDGRGASEAMRAALGGETCAVDDGNIRAASKARGDEAEVAAIEAALGPGTTISSPEGATGHLLGAPAALEVAFSVLVLLHRMARLTRKLTTPLASGLNFSMHEPIPLLSSHGEDLLALSISIDFGGVNTSLGEAIVVV